MKAEHRKELETNALADRVGRVVQGMKQAPQKRTLLYLMLAGVAVVFVLLYFRKVQTEREDNSKSWVQIEDGFGRDLQDLVQRNPQTNQAKTVMFEMAYLELRERLSLLAADPKQALAGLENIEKSYQELAAQCKDDKVLLPEALFAQAVIKEARILQDDKNWEEALAAYKELAEKHRGSAFGKLAQKRVDILEDKDKRIDVLNNYRELRLVFVREDRLLSKPPLPAEHPDIFGPPVFPGAPGIPKLELPKPELPKVDAPKTDAPKTDAPKTDAPRTDAPKTDAPKTGVPKAEAPKKEVPK